MSIDIEYAIKKDIRNNPIVRGVDLEQKREFQRTLWLAVLVVATLLFTAWQHLDVVSYGYQIEGARQLLSVETSTSRKLRIEIETLLAPEELRERATRELHLVAPSAADTIVYERAPATTAGKGIVASAR